MNGDTNQWSATRINPNQLITNQGNEIELLSLFVPDCVIDKYVTTTTHRRISIPLQLKTVRQLEHYGDFRAEEG